MNPLRLPAPKRRQPALTIRDIFLHLTLPIGLIMTVWLIWGVTTTTVDANTDTMRPTVTFDCGAPVRIMPLGDSITQGSNSGVTDSDKWISYRYDLWHSLQQAGYYVDFVGSRTNGQYYTPIDGFDPHHQGAPGATANTTANSVTGYLTDNPADIVLLHIGTNDLNANPANTSAATVGIILNKIDVVDPDIVVVLARIINRVPFNGNWTIFNNNVEAMALARIAAGDLIEIIDVEVDAGLIYQIQPAGDMNDTLHPFHTGYSKMAPQWKQGLDTLLPVCFIAPTITSSPVTEAAVDEPYVYDVETDVNYPDRPTEFSLTEAPNGMIIDPDTGVINWTPAAAGAYSVTVEAHNVVGFDTQSYTIDVTAFEAPAITSTPVITGVIGRSYTYDVNATGNPTPTYSLTTKPAGMTIDTVTGLISWLPTTTGDHAVTVQATNSVGSDMQSYTIAVFAEPQLDPIPDDSAIVGDEFTITATASGVPAPTYSLDSYPAGMTIGATDGVIQWTPTAPGTVDVTVRATNSVGTDTTSFQIIVYEAPEITSLPIILMLYGEEYVYPVEATGTPPPTFTLTEAPSGMTIDAAGTITWLPAASGIYAVTVKASNLAGIDTQSYMLSVWQAPQINSTPDLTAEVDMLYAYDVNADGYPEPTYTLTVAPAGMTINASGLIQWTPTTPGTAAVTVQASNSAGNDTQSFTLTVQQKPEITSSPDVVAEVDTLYVYEVNADGYPEPTFTLTTAPAGMTINASGLIQWTPTAPGMVAVTVKASNSAGNDTQSFTLTVQQEPHITSSPGTYTEVGMLYTYDVNAVGYPEPTFSLLAGPPGMQINATTGIITWTPTASGQVFVTVKAANSAGESTQEFTIDVHDIQQLTNVIFMPTIFASGQ
ncbi:MAG: putative Ig domain-containing protein [Anaerolineae bacterium]|nr:putative Ig domain-containing protein [Anaerolineae bacterium]